jgi:hypothetical protein
VRLVAFQRRLPEILILPSALFGAPHCKIIFKKKTQKSNIIIFFRGNLCLIHFKKAGFKGYVPSLPWAGRDAIQEPTVTKIREKENSLEIFFFSLDFYREKKKKKKTEKKKKKKKYRAQCRRKGMFWRSCGPREKPVPLQVMKKRMC